MLITRLIYIQQSPTRRDSYPQFATVSASDAKENDLLMASTHEKKRKKKKEKEKETLAFLESRW